MVQYVHLLPNSFGSFLFPRDLWVPSTGLLHPQKADQIALGFAHHYREDYEISLEGYYKTLIGAPDYKDGANLLSMGDAWEQQLLQGTGRSYGVELFAQKNTGAFTGWAGYTLSWTDRHFDDLNGGKRFPYKYDRRHDFTIAFMQKYERVKSKNKKNDIEFSATWVFGSGYCVTLPVGIVDVGNPILHGAASWRTIQYTEYGERNGYRLAPYHRLDLSITFVKKKKRGESRSVYSLYNAYNRKNPYHVNVEKDERGNYKLKQFSLFPIIPGLSGQFIF